MEFIKKLKMGQCKPMRTMWLHDDDFVYNLQELYHDTVKTTDSESKYIHRDYTYRLLKLDENSEVLESIVGDQEDMEALIGKELMYEFLLQCPKNVEPRD